MLDYYDPLLILKHLEAIRTLFLPLLNKKAVDAADQYLVQLKRRKKLKNPTFIGVHVRRTDYLSWIKTQFKGTPVDENYFKYAFEQFRKKYEEPIFVVLSDDRKWCMTHLKDMGSDVVFPVLKTDLVEPAVQDFVLLVQTNHTIFDYGSFGFLSSLLAGGDTMYATGYSVKKHPILQALHKAAPWNWEHVDVSQGHIFY
ncbi:galactoside 2-alpha-L-fucosyltransferase 2 [Eurytemora carolleeae]|uniref:galactoside 2-alpha-L-fucosyltransferase 2 n=1 Tax=Eurytemora carolleeae TaxID=1294199 RepID=UPI000C787039|nr:galactoside 2-alpha-L-fucosyltransferase 2 [Eurytemora carolleeae]|eukprot:XP_023328002.1 galactoside 2-alpha-L-fucosyltransferase 2-like [Eurytemora affinis]